MRYLFFCWICFSLPLNLAWSQVIVSRSFEGLKRTQQAVVERLTQQAIGAKPDLEILSGDVRRLKNFISIIDAAYQLDTLEEGIHLIYLVREGTSRYPAAKLGGLKGDFWWELGYTDQNWQGRGEEIGLLVRQIDGRLGGKAFYSKPSLANSKWGFSTQLERYASQEPLYFDEETVDYIYENHNVGVSLFHHFRPEEYIQVGFTYFREDYAKVNPEQLTGPNARRELKQLYRLGYQLFEVSSDQLQPAGFSWQLSSELVLQKDQKTPFYLLRAIWKKYYPIGKNGLLAGRVSLGYSANKDTPFAPFVVDSRINIRGAGNRVDRGTAAAIFNIEYRHLLWQKSWLSIQGVAFSDVGSWRNPGGTISDLATLENAKYFAGLGLRFISSGLSQTILRIDYGYGIQPVGRRGLVLGLGQYF